MLVLLALVTLFHLALLFKLIPYSIAWGGRLQNDEEMYVFESLSILINLFLGLILLMKGNYVRYKFKPRVISIILWCFFVLFVLNTVGNLIAKTHFEKLFSGVTLLFAVFIWMIQKTKNTKA